jgi:hypothetical protein
MFLSLTILMMNAPATTVLADPDTGDCKWPIGWWPLEVQYYIQTGGPHFTGSEAVRVSFGANTWSEANFNLSFNRVWSLQDATNGSRVFKGSTDPGVVAETLVYDSSQFLNPSCNMDAGNPIFMIHTVYNSQVDFHSDCLAVSPFCQNNGYFDLHATSAHEFGHWFVMYDSFVSGQTMYWRMFAGDTYQRTLTAGDRRSGHTMYGCGPGYSWTGPPHYSCSP